MAKRQKIEKYSTEEQKERIDKAVEEILNIFEGHIYYNKWTRKYMIRHNQGLKNLDTATLSAIKKMLLNYFLGDTRKYGVARYNRLCIKLPSMIKEKTVTKERAMCEPRDMRIIKRWVRY